MPRGIPNKKIETTKNNMKETLDKENILDNAIKTDDAPAKSLVSNDIEYTVSPDGKYKIPKPKKHADFLDKQPTRIPYITDKAILAEYHIYWQTDERPHNISDMIKNGYEFVDNNVPGYEEAIPTHSGYRPDGSAYMSYCFRIPISKYKEIEKMRQDAISEQEKQNLLTPGGKESPDLYATEQMKLGGAAAKKV